MTARSKQKQRGKRGREREREREREEKAANNKKPRALKSSHGGKQE